MRKVISKLCVTLIDLLAQNDTVFQTLGEIVTRELFSNELLNPLSCFLFSFSGVFRVDFSLNFCISAGAQNNKVNTKA